MAIIHILTSDRGRNITSGSGMHVQSNHYSGGTIGIETTYFDSNNSNLPVHIKIEMDHTEAAILIAKIAQSLATVL